MIYDTFIYLTLMQSTIQMRLLYNANTTQQAEDREERFESEIYEETSGDV